MKENCMTTSYEEVKSVTDLVSFVLGNRFFLNFMLRTLIKSVNITLYFPLCSVVLGFCDLESVNVYVIGDSTKVVEVQMELTV